MVIDMTTSMAEIIQLAADCLYGIEPEPITTDEAEYTISCWKEEGHDLPEGLTPENFAAAWNSLIGVTA